MASAGMAGAAGAAGAGAAEPVMAGDVEAGAVEAVEAGGGAAGAVAGALTTGAVAVWACNAAGSAVIDIAKTHVFIGNPALSFLSCGGCGGKHRFEFGTDP